MKAIEFLNEFMTAYYDTNTNKIMNCTENSIIWFHEKRHLIQQEKYSLFTYITILVWFGIVLIILSEQWKIAYGILAILILPEIDAWLYAIYMITKKD